jgi:hypothetical protein
MSYGKEQTQQKYDGNWYVLVCGLSKPKEPLILASGLSLCSLDNPMSVFDLAAAGAVGFHGWSVLEPVAKACTCEIESAKDSAVVPGYDTLNRAWLASALLVLRGFTRHLCLACSSYSWNLVAGHQKRTSHIFEKQLREEGPEVAVYKSKRELPPFAGNLLDYHLRLLIDSDTRKDSLTKEDLDWIQQHYEVFNRLAAENESFRLALGAAIDWRYAKDARTAIARLWSGIESIFGITSELIFRISLISASLLEEPGEARKTRFRAVKKLYGLRSKAVHGESLPEEKVLSAMNDSFHLLKELLLLTIEKGHVLSNKDFDDSVFG